MNFITTNESAIFYECGYSCDNAILLVLGGEKFFITDSRYLQEAKELESKAKNTKAIITSRLLDSVVDILNKTNYKNKKLVYDTNDMSINTYNVLKSKTKYQLKAKNNFLQLKRIIKTNKEIKKLSKGAKIAREGFREFEDYINNIYKNKAKAKEYEINFKAKEVLSQKGRYALSFEPITAIEENSARAHAVATNKKLKTNDLVLFDGGIKYKNYCTDKTRTILNKKNKNYKLQKKVYDIVQKAQDAAMSVAKEGIKASKVDQKAREVIQKAGFLKYFIHSTGHGVGLDIHELPFISKNSDIILQENMVFTIEPGIYLPDNFGVRIEETFYIKNQKAVRI